MAASRNMIQTQDSRGGGSDGQTCRLPNGIRTAPVTSDVVASSRDQPHKRAHGTNAGTVTTTHGLPATIARNARSELPALAAAVVKDGKIVAVGAVGTRKAGATAPVTVHDRFHLGSDTKAMTALLAAMFVEEGKLRWDTTVAAVFPE